MNKKVRIGILGMGGIGGFVGAPLAQYYANDNNVELVFICRGSTLAAIKNEGLHFKTKEDEIIIRPDICSDNGSEIGILDVLILSTKSYSLKNVIAQYSDVIDSSTIIITLQNMVNASDVVREMIPDKGIILEGCIYVASNVESPGHVEHVGGPGKIFIDGENNKYAWVTDLLTDSGLDVTNDPNIREVLWKKFLFVAPVAALTSAYKITFGQILEDQNLMHALENMMLEIQALAIKNGINLSKEDIQNSKDLLSKFPYESKSSLQLDFENHRQTEKEFLVDYIIDNCDKLGIASPYYKQIDERIKSL